MPRKLQVTVKEPLSPSKEEEFNWLPTKKELSSVMELANSAAESFRELAYEENRELWEGLTEQERLDALTWVVEGVRAGYAIGFLSVIRTSIHEDWAKQAKKEKKPPKKAKKKG